MKETFKKIIDKYVYKSYILNIYKWTRFGFNGRYAIKPKQSKDEITYIVFTYKSYAYQFKCLQMNDGCWIVAVT